MYEYDTEVQKILEQARKLRADEIARISKLALAKVASGWRSIIKFNNQWTESIHAAGREKYLSYSTDVYDLERRQRNLERNRTYSYYFQ